jgi:replicative DNA helicase
MKLFSSDLEHSVIRSICSSSPAISSYLLGSLDKSFFYYEPTKAAFDRIYSVAKKRAYTLQYSELLADTTLEEEYRDILREGRPEVCKDPELAKRKIAVLDKYRKARIIYQCNKDMIEALKQPKVDIDLLLDTMSDSITSARSKEDVAELIHSVGKDGNAEDLVEEALSVEDEVLLKVGFKEIDEKNGGIPAEGVMILASTTSGGKSTMLMNMLMNIYRLNKVSCSNVSLEMNKNKLTRRMLSKLTKIPYWKFVKKALSEDERDIARKAWRRFHRFGVKHDCQFSIICPTHSVGITQLLTLLKPYGHKVIGIDYISLLEGVDGNDQWKALSSIAREAKIFSGANKCLIILLAQLDADDDRIRYSKGILEHADCAWSWNYYKPEVRETKTMPIRQLKARDQELFPFDLKEDFAIMSVFNPDDDNEPTPSQNSDAPKLDLSQEPEMEYEAGQA